MGNRIIKESICTSDTIDELSWFEEVFFYRLIVNCDDYGRTDARPTIIKARLFPLKKGITEKQITDALDKLSSVGLAQVYTYDQKPYLQITTWGTHQNIRNKKSKYPEPPVNLHSVEFKCNQVNAFEPPIQSNPIQSEFNIMPEAFENAPDSPVEKIVIELALNDNTFHSVYESDVDKWSELYPNVYVMQELRNMKGWLDANRKRRKTKSGIERFVNSWLANEQNKGKTKIDESSQTSSVEQLKAETARRIKELQNREKTAGG